MKTFYVEHYEMLEFHYAVCMWFIDEFGNETKKFFAFCKKFDNAMLIAKILNDDLNDKSFVMTNLHIK